MGMLFKKKTLAAATVKEVKKAVQRRHSNLLQTLSDYILNIVPNIPNHSLFAITAHTSPTVFHKAIGRLFLTIQSRIINLKNTLIVYHNLTQVTGTDLIYSNQLSRILTNQTTQSTSAGGLLSGQQNPRLSANSAPTTILNAIIGAKKSDQKLVYIVHANEEMFTQHNMDLLMFLSSVIRKQEFLTANNVKVVLISDNIPDTYLRHFHALTIEDSELRKFIIDTTGATDTTISSADGVFHSFLAKHSNVFERNITTRIRKFIKTHFSGSGVRLLLPDDIEDVEPIGQSNFLTVLQRFSEKAVSPSHTSWLFFGPPGTGKTYSARYLAKKLNKPLIIFSLSDIKNSLYGQSEANLRNFLRLIEEVRDIILFIDEFGREFAGAGADTITDSGVTQSLTSMFLQWIQSEKPIETILIAASNEFDHLPDALLRPGRFGLYAKYDFLYRTELPIILDLIKQRLDFWAAKGVKIDDSLYEQAVELANSTPELPSDDTDLQQYINECRAENLKALTPADIVQIVDNAVIMSNSLTEAKNNIMLVFDRVSDKLIEILSKFKGVRVWS